MGQSSSTPHEPSNAHRRLRPFHHLSEGHSRDNPRHGLRDTTDQSQSSHLTTSSPVVQHPRPVSTFSRQISSQSVSTTINQGDGLREPSTGGGVFYGGITHISATPLPRRSTLSRLQSTLTFGRTRSGRWNTGRRTSRPHSTALVPSATSQSGSGIGQEGSSLPDLHPDFSDSRADSSPADPDMSGQPSDPQHDSTRRRRGIIMPNPFASPSPLALSRIRTSVIDRMNNLNQLSQRSANSERHDHMSELSGSPSGETRGLSLPFLEGADGPLEDSDASVGLANNLHPREGRALGNLRTLADTYDRRPWLESLNSARFTDRSDAPRATNFLRRSSPRITQQAEGNLWSQLMTATAMSIASQIVASRESSGSASASQADSLESIFHPIYQALQHAMQAHSNGANDQSSEVPSPAPNVLRVVRVGPPTTVLPNISSPLVNNNEAPESDRPAARPLDEISRNRGLQHVTIVVVAVQSAISSDETSPATQSSRDTAAELPPAGAITNLPPLHESSATQDAPTIQSIHSTRRPRFAHLRRASHHGAPVNFGWSQNRNRASWQPHVPFVSNSLHSNSPSTATGSSPGYGDSPPGPVPPPSTPAEHNLSAVSSQPATPSRRQSLVSPANHPALGESGLPDESQVQDDYSRRNERPLSPTRYRRRSESDSTRHRHFGAGAARRNGVVEPDSVEGGHDHSSRNWLVYVVGTSLSGDNPAWTTPNLFGENATYEDMLMLSSLLGPVKPVVASAQDVEAAKGIFLVSDSDDGHLARSLHDSSVLHMNQAERCLICLDGYQGQDEVRQLGKCSHFFHRGCIDEWLTTGRNSCPLCREEGVEEVSRGGQNRGDIAPAEYGSSP